MQVSIPKTAASIFDLSRRTVEYAEVNLRVGRVDINTFDPLALESFVLFCFYAFIYASLIIG